MTHSGETHSGDLSQTAGGAVRAAAKGLRRAIEALAELHNRGGRLAQDRRRREAAEQDLSECSRRLADALAELQQKEARDANARRKAL